MEAIRAQAVPGGARVPARARALAPNVAVLALGVGLFAIHARAYAGWLVDDAGISVAYATNFARGLGLVSQPGNPAVEGYTDALWVFLLASLARVGALALPGTLKLVGGALAAATYASLLGLIRRTAVRPVLVGAAVLVFCSANPAFVIWCMSGLENALYAFTVVLLAHVTLRALDAAGADAARTGPMILCGAVAFFVATTRPDGVLFGLLPPILAVLAKRSSRRTLVAYAASFGGPMALFVLLRLAVFHHLVPNTYVAKGGLRLADALAFVMVMPAGVHKLEGLLEGAFSGVVANGVFFAALVCARVAARRGRFTLPLATLVAFAFTALADYMLLPKDRMDEHRFGTAFYPLYYCAVFALFDAAIDVPGVRKKGLALAAIAGSLLLASFPDFAGRALLFARAPNIGLFYVRHAFAERIDRYADALHVQGGSVLLPDVGAMLLWSRLRVIDAAGLCDAEIARTLWRDPPAARRYIFGDVRPTFIHTHNIWAKALSLEEDPRFWSDYAPIHAYGPLEDPESEGHAAGLFVRRDVLEGAGGDAALGPLRRESHYRLGFLPPPEDSLVLRWLDHSAIVPEEYWERLSLILRDNTESFPGSPHPVPKATP